MDETKKTIKRDIQKLTKKLNLQQYVCDISFKNILAEDENIDDIWTRIKKLAPQQSQWEILVPTQWIEMERHCQQLAKKGKPVVKYKDLLNYPTTDEYNTALFVKYMKKSGLLLAIGSGDLTPDDDICVDPQWIIDAFKQVIDFSESHESGYGTIREIAEGMLSMQNAEEVWKTEKFKHSINTLLTFMEYLGLIARPKDESGFYYIPSLLENVDKGEIRKWFDMKKPLTQTFVLDFRKNGTPIPFPHFDKLMAKVIATQSKECMMSDVKRNCCIARIKNESVCFIICHAASIIKVTLFATSQQHKDKLSVGKIGTHLVEMVLDISCEIARRFDQRVQDQPVLGISCNPYPPIGDVPAMYATINELQGQKSDVSCCKSADCRMVQWRDLEPWQGLKCKNQVLVH